MKLLKDYISVFITLLIIISYLFIDFIDGSLIFTSGDSLSPLAVKKSIKFYIDMYGEFPYWFPSILGGMPTVHSFLYISEFYFPHKIMMILYNNGLPWIWNFLFHLVFGGLGTYLLLQFLNQSKLSSFFGSILFLLMPYMITMMAYGHGSQMMSSSYIPWIILYLFKIYKNNNLFNIIVLSILVGFQLQRGHIQIAYYTWMMIGLFAVISLTIYFLNNKFSYFKIIKTKSILLASLFLGFLVSLSIYLPILNYSSQSIRGASEGGAGIHYATQWSMSIKEFLTLIFPYSLGFGGPLYFGDLPFTDFPNYIGIIIIFFSVIGLYKSKIDFIYKLFFFLVTIFSLLISLGSNFISFYNLFYNYMPYFDQFRVPAYILILTNFSIIIIASCGLDVFIASTNYNYFKNKYNYITIIGIIVLTIIYKFFSYILIPHEHISKDKLSYINELNLINYDSNTIILISLALLLSYTFFNIKKFKNRYLYYIIILLFTYDYYRISKEIISPDLHIPHKKISKSTKYIDKFFYKDEIMEVLELDTEKFRIYDYLGQDNRWSIFGIESINGYHPAKLNNYNKFINKVQNAGYQLWPEGLLKLLNIKYLVIPTNDFSHSSFTNLGKKETTYFGSNQKYDGNSIYVNLCSYNNYIPRLFYTNRIEYLESDKIYGAIINDDYDPLDIVYQHDLDINISFDNLNRSVELINWTPNEIKFQTSAVSNQFLVISEIFYEEGWTIYSDDIKYEIQQINNLVRGISIPPGQHEFIMRFTPIDLKYGSLLTKFGYFSILILLLYYLYRKKK